MGRSLGRLSRAGSPMMAALNVVHVVGAGTDAAPVCHELASDDNFRDRLARLRGFSQA